jgi:hypothetical protein
MWRCASCLGALAVLLFTQSCGYVGPVQPPSLHIPVAVTDLSAVETGEAIDIQFMLPRQTTDAVTIGSFHAVELRAGPDVAPFDFMTWLAGTKPVPVTTAQIDSAANESQPLRTSLPVSDWGGKHIVIAVRTAQKDTHYSQWSNVVRLRVVDPLPVPMLKLDSDPNGVKITIDPFPKNAKVRIFRRGPAEEQATEAGIADSPDYIDHGAEYGTQYTYSAVAFDDTDGANARSKPSESVSFTSIDSFSPSTPKNLTALAGPTSIELSWDRSPEPDVHGYNVFRSVDGGAFERISEAINLPAFSDANVQHGQKYSYQVSAVDVRNNESARSAPVQVNF